MRAILSVIVVDALLSIWVIRFSPQIPTYLNRLFLIRQVARRRPNDDTGVFKNIIISYQKHCIQSTFCFFQRSFEFTKV